MITSIKLRDEKNRVSFFTCNSYAKRKSWSV